MTPGLELLTGNPMTIESSADRRLQRSRRRCADDQGAFRGEHGGDGEGVRAAF